MQPSLATQLSTTQCQRTPLDSLFDPRAIALIGATDRPGSVGRTILGNLLADFNGPIFPVNPKHHRLLGLDVYPHIASVPSAVDLAVIATPALAVPSIVSECSSAGVRGAVIVSSGFRETGADGLQLENQVKTRRGQMRIVGPNCLGVMVPHIGLNASFASSLAKPGDVAFVSQSSALCAAILDWSSMEKIGFSFFASIGSMLDVGWGDLIDYLGNDQHTKSILCYMESVNDAREFISASRAVSSKKPIVVTKVGRTEAAAAAASHTGSLPGSDEAFDAALDRAGVLRVNTLEELFDMARLLAMQPAPHGPKLTIITNGSGPGALAVDSLVGADGQLASLEPGTLAELMKLCSSAGRTDNPIDIHGAADPELYVNTTRLALQDPNTDGVLVILAPQVMSDPDEVALKIARHVKVQNKPLLASWMGGTLVDSARTVLSRAGIPCYNYPDCASRAFALMWRYSDGLRRLYECPVLPPFAEADNRSRKIVEHLLASIRSSGRTLLTEEESRTVLSAYGIPVVSAFVASSRDEATVLAEKIGYPVALKLISESVTHKSDADGVRLDLRDAEAVRDAWEKIKQTVAAKNEIDHFTGVSVQQYVQERGIELHLGSCTDPQFGPVILFGAGGKLSEVLQDRAVGLPPLSPTLAARLIGKTRIGKGLSELGGRDSIDVCRLAQLLVRVAHLATEHHLMISKMDLNPLLATASGFLALDARIVLHSPELPSEALPGLAIRPYPDEYISHCELRDGTLITLRPIRPEDEDLLRAFHSTLSEETVLNRYFSRLSLEVRINHERLSRICFSDYDREIIMVAERDSGTGESQLIGVGRLSRLHDMRSAEFAIVISDQWQNLGLGTEFLKALLHIGQAEHLNHIVGTVLASNRVMLDLCRREGFTLHGKGSMPEYEVEYQFH